MVPQSLPVPSPSHRKKVWRGMGLHPLMGTLVPRGLRFDLGPYPRGWRGWGTVGLGRHLGLTSVFPEH